MTDKVEASSSDQENPPSDINENNTTNDSKQVNSEEVPGLLASALNFVVTFFAKPWQLAFTEVKLCNKKKFYTFVLLFLSFFFAETSITFSETIAFADISGFFGFAFVLSAMVAALFFSLGLSSRVAKLSSKIVLGIMVVWLLKAVWDIVDALLEIRKFCGSSCGNLFELMFSDFGLGGELIDFISIGILLIIPTFFLLFPCAFGDKVERNENLINKLREINDTDVNKREITNEDIAANMDALNKKGKAIFQAGVSKVKNIDVESMKSGAEETAADLKSVKMDMSIFSQTKVRVLGAGAFVLFLLWFIFPSSVEHPDAKMIERLLKAEPEMQQVAAFSQLLGSRAKLSIDVNDVDNCESYEFDDGDTGVVCDVSVDVVVAGVSESGTERMIFFNNPSKGWEYIGDE